MAGGIRNLLYRHGKLGGTLMRILQNRRGITLVEIVITAAIGAFILSLIAVIFTKQTTFLSKHRVRQNVMRDSRVCMDTILQLLRSGKAKTLVISTPASATIVPYSRVDFVLNAPLSSGTTSYAIYLENGTVFALEYHPTSPRSPTPLATNVTGLNFTSDSKDPALISVSLRMDARQDNSPDPNRTTSITLDNQLVRMSEVQ
jgi:type II secretory pathway pseudopilin PulG